MRRLPDGYDLIGWDKEKNLYLGLAHSLAGLPAIEDITYKGSVYKFESNEINDQPERYSTIQKYKFIEKI